MSPAKQRMRTILNPAIGKTPVGWVPTRSDYISVPNVVTVGTFRLIDMLNNPSILALLTIDKRVRQAENRRINELNRAHYTR